MKIHLLSGFLGSGKTTAIRTAAGMLMRSGTKTGVITNDQGIRLVDGGFLRAAGIPGRQVMNGCFCCNYSDLDRQIESLSGTEGPEIIFAESVGSCTDVTATVLKPLLRYRPDCHSTLTVVCDGLLLKMLLLEKRSLFEPEVEYIFRKQIEEGSLLLINKTDLLTAEETQALGKAITENFGSKTLLSFQANNEDPVAGWLAALDSINPVPAKSPGVDYEIYASGEAMMGWLDMDILVHSDQSDAPLAAKALVESVSRQVLAAAYPIGHIKWLIDDREKISLTTGNSGTGFPALPAATEVKLLLNARVQVRAEKLTRLVNESMAVTAAEKKVEIRATSVSAFQPGYPRPEYRMA